MTLRQFHPFPIPRTPQDYFISVFTYLFLPSVHIPWNFRTKILHAFRVSSIRATCPAHLNFLDFTILTILSDLYKSRSFTLCNILNCLLISSLLDPNKFLVTLFPNICNLFFSQSKRPRFKTNTTTVLCNFKSRGPTVP